MQLPDILKIKYPDANFQRDIILQDDGNGPYIAEWNLPNIYPNKTLLNKWSVDVDIQQQYILEQNKIANQPIYKQLNEIDLKSIRAIRTNDTIRMAELESDAAALRTKLL